MPAGICVRCAMQYLVPLDAETVAGIARRGARFRFATQYGGWWGHVVRDAGEAVQRSARRYVARLRGP
jgi:hypothetical protein